ncbi:MULTISPECIES: thiamine ABC transporter substrate binding subunit [Gemmobacter]|uniref:Thiamine-binding periplasmic protein n=2 Tax=Gemmobacter TaxID=204456 RepID=A0A2T6AVT8_9RHOB|nr:MULTISPECIES: thiamine ABC transporter substrate binding subunit [Gemmobacter]PTX47930.1 thiamine transport system substrate-binding protein [Gemmobacter caeni]TWI97348.1 thiamine transport system substrate-binding protein [Gemmobacter caeni]GHC30719.1 thiamine transporter substrate binding subunit [Gemmobacter nanjingensis]
MKSLKFAAGLAFVATSVAAETPVLNVLTYDSFVSEWGPGPAIETGFEAECSCDLRFIPAGDGAALLARVQLEGARTDADVVLGLDTNLTAAARETGLFAPHGQAPELDLPVAFEDANFVPYDWGWFAFVHNRTLDAPKNFRDLAGSDLKIVIQDPRSSTPGLGLLMWVKAAYGDEAAQVWKDLADNIVTVTPGWSEAYGMFLEGEADMVLSYTTSPAYHLISEQDDSKTAAVFDEGNYMQVEVMGKLAASDQPELADRFMAYMLSDAAQAVLPTTNWMYPAHVPAEGLPKGFETLVQPTKSLLLGADEAEALRAPALEEWRAALAR